MPSVFGYYRDRAEEYSVPGKANELIVTTRKGKGRTVSAINNDLAGLMQDNTMYVNGDQCTNVNTGIAYFITAQQSSTSATNCLLKKINCSIDILRISKHYTGTTYDYDIGTLLFSAVPSYYEDITGKMQQYDLGLKSTSTRRFMTTMLNLKLLDIIRFGTDNMQIDGINTTTYQGLLWIQCSPYTKTI